MSVEWLLKPDRYEAAEIRSDCWSLKFHHVSPLWKSLPELIQMVTNETHGASQNEKAVETSKAHQVICLQK